MLELPYDLNMQNIIEHSSSSREKVNEFSANIHST